jgi:hypothetical protein
MNLTFNSDKVYAIHFFGPKGKEVIEVEDMHHYDKNKVALEIGKAMIAGGCVAVQREYDLMQDRTHFIIVARPFSKERRLP